MVEKLLILSLACLVSAVALFYSEYQELKKYVAKHEAESKLYPFF